MINYHINYHWIISIYKFLTIFSCWKDVVSKSYRLTQSSFIFNILFEIGFERFKSFMGISNNLSYLFVPKSYDTGHFEYNLVKFYLSNEIVLIIFHFTSYEHWTPFILSVNCTWSTCIFINILQIFNKFNERKKNWKRRLFIQIIQAIFSHSNKHSFDIYQWVVEN